MTSVDPLDQVTLIMYTCREERKKSEMNDPTTCTTTQMLLKLPMQPPQLSINQGSSWDHLKSFQHY